MFILLLAGAIAFSFWPTNLNLPLQSRLLIPKMEGAADIGIVLGAGLKTDGEITELSKERVDKALQVHEESDLALLFSGGETPRGIEAVGMNEYAKQNGYDGLNHIEASSRSTYENAFYSDQLLDEGRFTDDTVLVITSAYHARRALATFQELMPERNILITYPDDSIILQDDFRGRWRGLYNLTRENLANVWYSILFKTGWGRPELENAEQRQLADTLTVTMSDGTEIVADYYAGRTNKAVILLHMLGQGRSSWSEYIPVYQQQGWHIIAVDLRGHGQSSGNYNNFGPSDFQAMPDDVVVIADWLRENKEQPLKVVVVGASLGANVALAAAPLSDSITAVVALSPEVDYPGLDIADVPAQLPVLLVPSSETAGQGINMLKTDNQLQNQIIEFINSQ